MLVLLLSAKAAQAEPGCLPPQGARAAQVSVSTPIQPITYQYGKTLRELQGLHNLPGALVGLTQTTPAYSWSVPEGMAYRMTDGTPCFWITGLKGVFGLAKQDVYVAYEYPAGTCEYGMIMNHENRHIRLWEQAVRDYAALVQQAAERVVAAQNPLRMDAAGSERFWMNMARTVDPLREQFHAHGKRLNAQIDTPQAYADDWSKCRKH